MLHRLRKRLGGRRNPHNLTRVHLARYVERHGFDVGDHSYGAPKIRWWGEEARLTIGRFCSIADHVEIFLGGNHRAEWVTTYPFPAFPARWPRVPRVDPVAPGRGDVNIGSDVWIGAGAAILSGVSIGHGAIIGARTVVTADAPPYSVTVGNPGRVARLRFSAMQIAGLLQTAWWDLDDATISELSPLLMSPDVDGLIEVARALRSAAAPNRPAMKRA
ncbi:MAG: CatB-related O-acetyltransferase [Hyphomicrobiales bacterium]|nr:CatB-related O-acetyltransferase [Hyphomicrobiales bacterium]MBV9112956.1 CatB-related O-acetyltransferase [Hyphomicrobiales bacterium]MBV9520850.1 CatB-related O-acetyltransferase [Hyphomicrobiales bacterium]